MVMINYLMLNNYDDDKNNFQEMLAHPVDKGKMRIVNKSTL